MPATPRRPRRPRATTTATADLSTLRWYHGGSAADSAGFKKLGHFPADYSARWAMWGAGIYLTVDREEAETFGEAVVEVSVDDAKLLDMRDPSYRAMPTTVWNHLSPKGQAAFERFHTTDLGAAAREGALADGYDGIVWLGDGWQPWAVLYRPELARASSVRRNPEAAPARAWTSTSPAGLGAPDLPAGTPGPAERIQEPAFRRWFGNSAVVDERGLPLLVWHGNAAWEKRYAGFGAPLEAVDPFDVFDFTRAVDIGMHFGTFSAARRMGPARPFYLRIENPLHMSDPGSWTTTLEAVPHEITPDGSIVNSGMFHFANTLHQLSRMGLFDQQDRMELRQAAGDRLVGAPQDRDSFAFVSTWLRAVLSENGYDGIVYRNEVEDKGSTSWVPFYPSQIKSAVENAGTWDLSDPNVRRNPRRR